MPIVFREYIIVDVPDDLLTICQELIDARLSVYLYHGDVHFWLQAFLESIVRSTLQVTVSLIELGSFIPYGDPVTRIVSLEGDDLIAGYAPPYIFSSGGSDAITQADILREPPPSPIFREVYRGCLEYCFWLLFPCHVFFPECSHYLRILRYGTLGLRGFFFGPVGVYTFLKYSSIVISGWRFLYEL